MKNVTYINAGAGSGKTFTLTNILVKKLGGMNGTAQSAVLPSQVLLTTFTDWPQQNFVKKLVSACWKKVLSMLLHR